MTIVDSLGISTPPTPQVPHLEPGLLLLRDATLRAHGVEILERLASQLRDPSVRIFAEGGQIHAMSSEFHLKGEDPFEMFEGMGIDDPAHAFYLGYEMHKAVTALTLGKDYEQDRALRWGFLTREEQSHVEKALRVRKRKPKATPMKRKKPGKKRGNRP